MIGFDRGDLPEGSGDLREALLLGHREEVGIELAPLFFLTLSRSQKVLCSRAGLPCRVLEAPPFAIPIETVGICLVRTKIATDLPMYFSKAPKDRFPMIAPKAEIAPM